MPGRLDGKRVLLTQADRFMGAITRELFAAEGATVIADTRDLTVPGACEAAVTVRLGVRSCNHRSECATARSDPD